MLISRWIVWLMILFFESVIGLPWVALWFFGGWLSLSRGWLEQGLILLITSVFFAVSYQVSLPIAGLVLGLSWLAHGRSGGFGAGGGSSRSSFKFWSIILLGGFVWWLKRDELQASWLWWSSILSWLVIIFTGSQRILWKKPKLIKN